MSKLDELRAANEAATTAHRTGAFLRLARDQAESAERHGFAAFDAGQDHALVPVIDAAEQLRALGDGDRADELLERVKARLASRPSTAAAAAELEPRRSRR